MQTISADAVKNHTRIPQEVKDHLSNFTEDMFTIRHLFMDFQDADLASFDKDQSHCPMPPPAGKIVSEKDFLTEDSNSLQIIQAALQDYFKSFAGSDNPYILGYAVESKQAGGENLHPTLDPTGSTFSTYYNSKDQNLNTLNFLVMTANRVLPTKSSAGLFDQVPVESNEVDGRFVIDKSSFFDAWLLEKLKEAWSKEIQPNEWYYSKMKDQSVGSSNGNSPNRGTMTFDNDSPPTWSFTYDVLYHWTYIDGWDCIGPNADIKKKQQDSRTFTVSIQNPSTSTSQVDMAGQYYIRRDWNFDCAGTPGHTWAQVKQPVTADLVVSGGTNGQLGQKLTVTPGNPDTDDGTSGWASKYIGGDDEGNRAKNLERFDTSIKNVDDTFVQSMNEASNRFVLPAGDVFFFKNPQFDASGNLLLDVTYKM